MRLRIRSFIVHHQTPPLNRLKIKSWFSSVFRGSLYKQARIVAMATYRHDEVVNPGM